MRDILTALAILLIVLLTGALAAPYFIDWNGQRGFLEARLSQALGEKVTIGGSIDLRLLPTPYLVLDQAVIGGDDGPVSMGIRHLDLELSITPLLHGEFEVVEARLEEPIIRIVLQRDRTLPALPRAPVLQADFRFDRIAVVDGTLAIADPDSGRTFSLDHLDFQAEADTLAGPFKGRGYAGASGDRTGFRLGTSAAAKTGQTRIKVDIDETPAHAGLVLDGALGLASTAGSLHPSFEGTATASGHLRGATAALLPWRLSGTIHADPLAGSLKAGELRLGGETHSLTLAAEGGADLGAAANLHIDLVGKQLDLDLLAMTGVAREGDAPPPPSLRDFVAAGRALTAPLPTTVTTSVATMTYGGDTLSDLAGRFVLGATGASPVRFAGNGPGGIRVSAEGTADAAPGQPFRGAVALTSSDVPASMRWANRIAPGLGLPPLPFRRLEARGDVTIGAADVSVDDATLRVDRSVLKGRLRATPARLNQAAVLVANLRADALDVDALPDVTGLRTSLASTDLDLTLDTRAIKVGQTGADEFGAGHVSLALKKSGDTVALDAFRIEGLGGATVDATGRFDPQQGGRIDAGLDARDLTQIAALLRRAVPGRWSDGLAKRAAALSPAKLTLSAVFPPSDPKRSWVPRQATVSGIVNGTRLDASVSPNPSDASTIVAGADVSAPDAGAFLAQVGLPTLPVVALGAAHVVVQAQGLREGAFASTARASIGATTLEATGRFDPAADAGASGTVRLASPDLSSLAQSLALAFPDLTGKVPADLEASFASTPFTLTDLKGRIADVPISGSLQWASTDRNHTGLTGALVVDRLSAATLLSLALGPARPPAASASWSSLPFGAGLIDPPSGAIKLSASTFDAGQGISGTDASLTLGVSTGLVALHDLRMHLAGGDVAADLTVRRDGSGAALEGKLSLADVGLAVPAATGRLNARLDLAGSGRSALDLVGSLAGTGNATIADLQIPRADPAGLPKVFEDVEADRLSVDEDSIARALDEAAARPLVVASRSFSLNLAAGVLHLDPKPEAVSPTAVKSLTSAGFDLRSLSLDERIEQTLQALPKGWSGPAPQIVVSFAGPVRAPTRTTDASGFVNALAARALARESARIEAYEFDARERAFFSQRLQSDRRREQDRLKVEEDARLALEAARRAEAERRARDVAARAERARKAEDAAHAAAEKATQDRATQDRAVQERAAGDAARERTAPQRRSSQAPADTAPAERNVDPPARPQGQPIPGGLY